jgi:hypothetical protein
MVAASYNERDIIGVSTGFLSFFGRGGSLGQTVFSPDANLIEIDIMRGNEKIAKTVLRGEPKKILDKKSTNDPKFSAFARQYPLIFEQGPIHAGQLTNRLPGENPRAGGITRKRRLLELAISKHMEHIRRTVRTCEVLAAQAILTGIMDAIIGTSDTGQQYDFQRNSAHTVTVGTEWNNAASDPLTDDIDPNCDKIRQNGHLTPDMMILGSSAMSAFINHADVIAQADNRRFELIQVSTNNPVPPRFAGFVEAGFIARGRLRTPAGYELWLFTYIDSYQNDAGTAVKFMPADKVLICSSSARCDRYFGPPEMLPLHSARILWMAEMLGVNIAAQTTPMNIKGGEKGVPAAAFFHNAFPGPDDSHIVMETQLAPIFAPVSTDGFVLLEGVFV